MNTSIQISSSAVESAPRTARGEVVKLVQGALLVAVAAVAAAGTASVAAPFCVWKGEVALFLNESFHAALGLRTISWTVTRPFPARRGTRPACGRRAHRCASPYCIGRSSPRAPR